MNGPDAALSDRLTRELFLVPLASADVDQYGLFELADAISVRCAAHIEPDALQDPQLRERWLQRALQGEALSEPFTANRHPYWIVDDGERIGTIAFAAAPAASAPTIEISSVYVLPKHRRKGWGSRALQTLRDAAFDCGFRRATLQVEWNNQDALRFYCAQGMWVAGWKNAIELYFSKDQPRWHVELQANEALFKVKGRVAGVALNQGHYLDWSAKKTSENPLKRPLEQTAAVQLALLPWPIIRSDKLWQEQLHKGWSDNGPFEGFALRLRQFERHIRNKTWNLPAERNPSFATLPTLSKAIAHNDQLEAQLSDGTTLTIPYAALGLPEQAAQALQVQTAADEVTCTLQSGTPLVFNIDYLLYLTQSPEHLARAATLVRQAART
jgi:ribosomal protein S18 acetylase RimI-like enzyme